MLPPFIAHLQVILYTDGSTSQQEVQLLYMLRLLRMVRVLQVLRVGVRAGVWGGWHSASQRDEAWVVHNARTSILRFPSQPCALQHSP